MPAASDADRLRLRWLLRLRWAVVAGALAVLGAAALLLDARPPWAWVLGLLAVTVVTNLAGARSSRRPRAWAAALLVVDVVALTALLWLTGRASNPFTSLYLVYIAVAVVSLGAAASWGLVALAAAGFAALFTGHDPHAHHDMALHLRGMWAAFAVSAAAIVYFVGRLETALRRRDAELAAARDAAAKAERLAALGTLAAGAAHELASPLGTIAVAAGELARDLESQAVPAESLDDLRLIRREVDRCREVLDGMSVEAGAGPGEPWARVELVNIVAAAAGDAPLRTSLAPPLDTQAVCTYPRALERALRALIDNARLASPPGEVVEVRAEIEDHALHLAVRDVGPGMAPVVLARATEPFFTTRPAGAGMGLGLFLARALAEGVGGHLALANREPVGVEATLRWPLRQDCP
ncbi:MAG: HAMP domain-containing histidine kinase [Myxococcales bacterium]|nr:HAMP domain-containing histidine kinase [Myxococcales bacterium]